MTTTEKGLRPEVLEALLTDAKTIRDIEGAYRRLCARVDERLDQVDFDLKAADRAARIAARRALHQVRATHTIGPDAAHVIEDPLQPSSNKPDELAS